MALSTHQTHAKRHLLAAPVHQVAQDQQVPLHCLLDDGLGEQTTYELLSNELLLDGRRG